MSPASRKPGSADATEHRSGVRLSYRDYREDPDAWARERISKAMGGNFLRVLEAVRP